MMKTDSLAAYGIFFGLGTLIQTIMRSFLDRLVFPGNRSVDDEIEQDKNWGIASVEAAVTIVLSLSLSALLRDVPCVGLA